MQQLGALAHRWRYLVVAVEVLIAVGCVYFGFQAVSPPTGRAPVQIRRAPGRPQETGAALGLPLRQPAGTVPRPSATRPRQASDLTSDGMSRLNRDDFELYRRQWQVLQMLMDGVRTYLEQRVVPRLLSR